jgi:A/G-specific adenine glycosylase
MELGAMLCTPRAPQCLLCPVREHCEAHASGTQEQIPAPKKSRPIPLNRRRTYCIGKEDQWLIEQRPARGRWAGMWQFVTVAVETEGNNGHVVPVRATPPKPLGEVAHTLTHRRYLFEVFVCEARDGTEISNGIRRQWTTLDRLHEFPLPRPHLKIAEMLRTRNDVGLGKS